MNTKTFGLSACTFYIYLNLVPLFMQGKYKVYNLCSERLYDASLFEGKVCSDCFSLTNKISGYEVSRKIIKCLAIIILNNMSMRY